MRIVSLSTSPPLLSALTRSRLSPAVNGTSTAVQNEATSMSPESSPLSQLRDTTSSAATPTRVTVARPVAEFSP